MGQIYPCLLIYELPMCLGTTMAELNSCHRNDITQKTGNIYSLASHRNSLPTPGEDQF
jgi:hypothetical protein